MPVPFDNEVLWRCYCTSIEMLSDRKYQLCEEPLDINNFPTLEDENLDNVEDLLTLVAINKLEKLCIFWNLDPKFGNPDVQKFIDMMVDLKHAIIVVHKRPNNTIMKTVKDFQQVKDLRIEFFTYNELVINITKHVLQPKFVVCSKKTKDKLLEQYAITGNQLPKMSPQDPIARYYGARAGKLFKIERKSENAGSYLTYRIVSS